MEYLYFTEYARERYSRESDETNDHILCYTTYMKYSISKVFLRANAKDGLITYVSSNANPRLRALADR